MDVVGQGTLIGLKIEPLIAELMVGDSTTLALTFVTRGVLNYEALSARCAVWSSSDPAVARVGTRPGGPAPTATVTGVRAGAAVVSASCDALQTALTLQVTNPVPLLGGLTPAAVARGSGGFILVVTGLRFVETSVVRWGNTELPTFFVAPTELRVAVPGSLVAAPGLVPVSVMTPAPGGGQSNAISFSVTGAVVAGPPSGGSGARASPPSGVPWSTMRTGAPGV